MLYEITWSFHISLEDSAFIGAHLLMKQEGAAFWFRMYIQSQPVYENGISRHVTFLCWSCL